MMDWLPLITAIIGLAGTTLIASMTAVAGFVGGTFLERQKSQEWAKKEQWQFKRDTYLKLLEAMTNFKVELVKIRFGADKAKEKGETYTVPDDGKSFVEALTELQKRSLVASIFLSAETNANVLAFKSAFEIASSTDAPPEEMFTQIYNGYSALETKVLDEARSDMIF